MNDTDYVINLIHGTTKRVVHKVERLEK